MVGGNETGGVSGLGAMRLGGEWLGGNETGVSGLGEMRLGGQWLGGNETGGSVAWWQ